MNSSRFFHSVSALMLSSDSRSNARSASLSFWTGFAANKHGLDPFATGLEVQLQRAFDRDGVITEIGVVEYLGRVGFFELVIETNDLVNVLGTELFAFVAKDFAHFGEEV